MSRAAFAALPRLLAAACIALLACAHRTTPSAEALAPTATTQDRCWSDADGDADATPVHGGPSLINRSVFRRGETEQPEAIGQAAAQSIAENCPFGAPKKQENFGPTVLVGRRGYALEHSSELKIPIWVCEHVKSAELKGDADRNGAAFAPDPELEAGKRAELADYKGSGFDRGHQAPAGDFKSSDQLMRESFFLSNMAPQVGSGFNQHVWAWLEDYARQIVRDYGQAWIITGGFFDPSTTHSVIGPDEVAVPTHFFKIVVVSDETGTDAVGFVLENRRYKASETANGFQRFVTPIDQIEAKTGLDFLSELPSNLETPLEHATPDLSTW